ncbi:hypothetical protein MHLNE_03510 [Moorella humiferrea]
MLIKTAYEGYRSFDKAILALAAGSFGLSLTFMRQIAPAIKPASIRYLIIAWFCFSLSILSTLISFQVSALACQRQIKIAEEFFFGKGVSRGQGNLFSKITFGLNLFSIFAFIGGVGFLVAFSIINLNK